MNTGVSISCPLYQGLMYYPDSMDIYTSMITLLSVKRTLNLHPLVYSLMTYAGERKKKRKLLSVRRFFSEWY